MRLPRYVLEVWGPACRGRARPRLPVERSLIGPGRRPSGRHSCHRDDRTRCRRPAGPRATLPRNAVLYRRIRPRSSPGAAARLYPAAIGRMPKKTPSDLLTTRSSRRACDPLPGDAVLVRLAGGVRLAGEPGTRPPLPWALRRSRSRARLIARVGLSMVAYIRAARAEFPADIPSPSRSQLFRRR